MVAGKNPFGAVSSGSLKLRRHLQSAQMKYVYTRHGFGSSQGRREIDKLKYDIQIGHIELPFFADHILCDEGPHHLDENQEVWVMALHPHVCLVLKKTGSLSPLLDSSCPLDESSIPTFQRIGIVRQPLAFLDTYLLDWMASARPELVMIN